MFDEDFCDVIKPIYLLHIITCAQKYVITNRSVQFIGVKHFLINFIALIGSVILLELALQTFRGIVNLNFFIIYSLNYSSHVINFTTICFLNFFYRSVNYKLCSYMCYLNFSLYDEKQSKILKKISWSLFIILITMFSCQVVLKTFTDPYWFTVRAIYLLASMPFEVEFIYLIFVASFLFCKLEKWIKVVKLRSSFQEVDSDEVKDECHWLSSLFQTHLDCIALMEKTMRLILLIHFIAKFFQILGYFLILLIWAKEHSYKASTFSGIQLWLLRLLLIQIGMCLSCEMVYMRIRLARTTALRMLTLDITPTWRQFAKNIVRSSKIKKISAFGIFSVDAALPLRAGSLILTYIIVLVQFVILK